MNDTEGFLRNAYCIARQSKDASNQNGSVLVDSKGDIIGTGNNNFPIGVEFTQERASNRPTKYRYFEHAERNSIYQAARAGNRVVGATMYCPWAACCDCARAIIQSGVSTLIMHQERMQMTPVRWQSQVEESMQMFNESGVYVLYYKGKITGCPDIFVNGEIWNPSNDPVENGNFLVAMGEDK